MPPEEEFVPPAPIAWRSGSFVPGTEARETLRELRAGFERAYRAEDPDRADRRFEQLERATARGWIVPVLWVPARGPARGSARGLLYAFAFGPELRIDGIYLEPASAEAWRAFLNDVERESPRPLASLPSRVPGLPFEVLAHRMPGRGYWYRALVRLERPGDRPLPPSPPSAAIHPLTHEDAPALPRLLARAYSERPAEFWTRATPDPLGEGEAQLALWQPAAGRWADSFRPDASFVWKEEGRVVGAVAVMEDSHRDPWIDDLVVDPEWHRRGIGRALLLRSLAALARTGATQVVLTAIEGGAPDRMYRALGFEPADPGPGGLPGTWVRGLDPRPGGVGRAPAPRPER
jgi:predicted N-acetyltransferase YhbS